MDDVSNSYRGAYVVAPIIAACRKHGLFELLSAGQFVQQTRLARTLNASGGALSLALAMLHSAGWLEKKGPHAYRATANAVVRLAGFDPTPLYAVEPRCLIEDAKHASMLMEAIETEFFSVPAPADGPEEWRCGAIIVPLMVSMRGFSEERFREELDRLDPRLSQIIVRLFEQQRWLAPDQPRLTALGRAVLHDRGFAALVAHRPVLHQIDELLFGSQELDIAQEPNPDHGTESRLRALTAGLGRETYREDLLRTILDNFARSPARGASPAVVGIACGEDDFPDEAVLTASGIAYCGLQNSFDRLNGADRLRSALEQSGLTAEHDVLYLDFALNHRFTVRSTQPVNDALSVLASDHPPYLDDDARPLAALAVLSGWQQRLRWIAESIDRSRLVIVQAHAATEARNGAGAGAFDEGLDGLLRLSREYLISAEAFIILAATVGLFNQGPAKRYPQTAGECRMSLHHWLRRDYLVRHAAASDLGRLEELETLCWQHTRSSRSRIARRLHKYPQGQFVLEKSGKVLGVIYSQRIAGADLLEGRNAANIHELHQDDGEIIQLIAVNMDPETQDLGYGDQLLEFMLQRCAFVAGVSRVVAVTLCKSYDRGARVAFEDYIRLQGAERDPVLAFHHRHGAEILKSMPDYRPQDLANEGHGVLVDYDILHRMPRVQRPRSAEAAPAVQRKAGIEPSLIRQFVRRQVTQLLAIDDGELADDRPLMELGLDSADLLKLQQVFEAEFAEEFEPGFFFEYNSIAKVLGCLTARSAARRDAKKEAGDAPHGPDTAAQPSDGQIAGRRPKGTRGEARRENAGAAAAGDIAIIGVACRLPGGIETPGQLWKALVAQANVIGPYPESRGEWPTGAERAGIDQGGFVVDVDAFDAAFFRLSPAEAQITDPQQRMLLELAWTCLEDAGILPAALKGSDTGVYVGASNCDYSRLMQEAGIDIEAHHGVGSSLAILANRLSYFFDLSGPSLLIDTACSSSLVALHTAVQSLRAGECTSALVGGVNLICHPDLSVAYHKAGMLAADGRCKVFDAAANGYVRSEGAVVMLLKPLRTALAAGDRIQGVIKGSAINHGGLAGGLTVPNPQKQAELLRAAWRNAGIAAGDLTYIEAHGTGTSLGDPIEIQGIRSAFGDANAAAVRGCAIGSVKSNLGHLESAAGVTGLLKILLSLQHGQIPASINFTMLNPKIHLEGTPFHIQDRLSAWNATGPRVAGVSSFGSGGANAHVVVQEWIADERVRSGSSDHLFVLSAADGGRLKAYVERVIAWAKDVSNPADFADAIHTWQIGRAAMKHRLAIKVNDRADLERKLGQWLAGHEEGGSTWSGRVDPHAPANQVWKAKSGQQLVFRAVSDGDIEQLGILWTSGVDIDWAAFHAGEVSRGHRPARTSVPSYPFAKERYWIETGAPVRRAEVAAGTVLHPMLHRNVSDLSEQRYESRFSGEEFYLADHQVSGMGESAVSVLPGVAYLEMARAALEQAVPEDSPRVLELRNTVWARPMVVTGERAVSVVLYPAEAGRIDYEIVSEESGERIVHCQGQGEFEEPVVGERLDAPGVRERMSGGRWEAAAIYAAFGRRGLQYGAAHRAIEWLERGEGELLAQLVLPAVVSGSAGEYGLHPSVLDGALQASIGLLEGLEGAGPPRLPFALESVRIAGRCSASMQAWVRYAPGSGERDAVEKLDIDIYDAHGTVCVQLRGFTSRVLGESRALGGEPRALGGEGTARPAEGVLLARPVWVEAPAVAGSSEAPGFTQHHVLVCGLAKVNLKKLSAGLPGSECTSVAEVPGNVAQCYGEYALRSFERLQGILRSKPVGRVLLQIVGPVGAMLGGLSGLLKSGMQENPQLVGQLIETAGGVSTAELMRQLQSGRAQPQQTWVREVPGRREALRWEVQPQGESGPVVFKDGGVYVITGGLGGLGRLLTREMVERGSAQVIVTGRGEADGESVRGALSALRGQVLRPEAVSYRRLDLQSGAQVREELLSIRAEHGRLDGIVHGAGMIADNFIVKKSAAEFTQVLRPKVEGTYHLDEASREMELDFLVLFGSVAGALGNVGQADYAAANGFMDQYAGYRNGLVESGERRGRTVSIDWPLWADGGMSVEAQSLELLQERTGMRPLTRSAGLQALQDALAAPQAQTLVLAGELALLRRVVAAGHMGRLEAPAVPATAPSGAVEGNADGVIAIAVPAAATLAERTQDFLRRQFSQLLKLPAQQIDPRAPMEQYGIDSILAMSLTNQLEKTFGSMSKTLFFEYRTIRELADYFVDTYAVQLSALLAPSAATMPPSAGRDRVGAAVATAAMPSPTAAIPVRRVGRPSAATAIQRPVPRVEGREAEPIAIIGLSGRYPGSADLEAYWSNLRDGRDCIIEVPKERWDWKEYFSEDRTAPGRHYSKWGGFIAGVDEFDPLFFNISPRDAKYLDPQERLFLQHAWMAVEDAGYTRASLQVPHENDLAGQVGVYVGVMYSEYQLYSTEANVQELRMGFAGNLASIANRVSHVLNLHGPSMTLDTMCSSSLTAIHVACQDLKQGRTDVAIAGGVNVSVHPNKYLMLSVGQFISGDGQCQSFGEGGDGYIPGEGVGAVVLRRLSEAQRDGHHIYGVITGSALSHGGRTNGYTVPNPQAQASAITRALSESGTAAREISYLEAHGTGTKLGDPIEIAALSNAFQRHTQEREFCLIGSAKSNIGHCESAAGIAGLTKVLLQMRHGQIVPSLHSSRLNPHIDFTKSPFVVNQTLRRWERPVIEGRGGLRIAGISSFGAGGSNAHMIVQEYEAGAVGAAVRVTADAPAAMVLSARTAEQLRQKAQDLLAFVEDRGASGEADGSGGEVDLGAVAYTLQVGREAMEERWGFTAGSTGELVEKLRAYVQGAPDIEESYQGQVKRNKEALSVFSTDADLQQTIEKWLAGKKLTKLLDLWVKGLEVDWTKLYGAARPGFVSLPSYPFAKERYWIETGAPVRRAEVAAGTVLHPMLHRNVSDLSEQRYESRFSGEEFFFAGQPGVAYWEMARAALERAVPGGIAGKVMELRDLVWAQPAVAIGPRTLSIGLYAHDDGRIDYEIMSEESGEPLVHAQGHGVLMEDVPPARLEEAQLLPGLRIPAALQAEAPNYWLHPSLMARALQSSLERLCGPGEAALPSRVAFAVDAVRIHAPCTAEMQAWVRHAKGSHALDPVVKLDIDLCDAQGSVRVQLRGVGYRAMAVTQSVAAAPTEPAAAAPTTGTARWIALSLPAREAQMRAPRTAAFEAMERRKPEGIALQTPQAAAARGAASMAGGVAGRGESVRLSDLTAAQPVPSEAQRGAQGSGVSLYDLGEGVFSIRLGGTAGNVLSGELIGELLGALERVREEPQLKVLLVEGRGESFARGGRAEQGAAVERGLYRALGGFGYPVIAVMQGDASGAGLLLGAVCDFMVCGEESSYGYTEEWGELYPDSTVEALFAERLGDGRAQELLYRGGRRTGLQLRESGWTCPIVPRGEVQTQGLKLARLLGAKSAQSLRLLKRHLMRPLAGRIEGLERVEERYSERESRVEESGAAWEFASGLELQRQGSTLVVRLGGSEPGSGSVMELGAGVAEMTGLLAQVNASAQCKTVVWVSEAGDFLSSAGAADEGRVRQLQGAVLDCRVPVIAVLAEEARGAAWLLGQCSDACYYRSEGRYGAGFEGFSDGLAGEAAMLGVYRLGRYVGRELALTGAQYTGEQLRRRAGLSTVEPGEQGLAAALGLAQSWSQWSMKTLERWKSGTAREIRERTAALEPFCKIERSEELRSVEAATAVELGSSVVTATVHPGGILVVKLQDRQSKNLFSEAFIAGVSEAFAHVASTPRYKAVILTGYDSYFASGGTKQSLLAIQEGRAKFTDFKIFQLAMECEVPVIAAMQGHGIGAGWSMGMFADLVLFSEESQYVSPYMSYGFTPGAGSTLIVAQQLGHDLARESLLTAQEYTGRELKRRGVRLPVLPREAVPGAALELARQMAQGSRSRLMGLKRQLTQPLHGLLEETYRLELAMHEATFVGQSDTLELIKNRFLQSEGAAPEEHRGADGAASFSAGQITAAVSAGAAAGDILAAITATLKKLLAQELHLQETDIEEHVQFVDLGLDSISGVTWIRQINEKYQTTIEATKVYSFPTLAQLSRHVKEQAEQQGTLPKAPAAPDTGARPPASARAPAVERRPVPVLSALRSRRSRALQRPPVASPGARFEPIAVIGMAGQFPQARNVTEFWQNIAQGRDCITPVSTERWDVDTYYRPGAGAVEGMTNSQWMGALEDYDRFDPLFFNISPIEAESMDPQQRLFLQACWQSVEDAGYSAKPLSGSRCGVFVGCAGGDYQQLADSQRLTAQGFTGNSNSILAARISYFMNLQGPCLSIDTACSSALVAIAHACDSLTYGVSDIALAGGVCVLAGPEMHIKTSQAGMLSPDGRCFTFDQRANGFVPGEAVGVVMLKRLTDAERDQDCIHGVIRGWGINQDGKTNGITAPNPESQTRLQQEVYDKYQIDPNDIQLIEAHGTGTQLGDPIEVEGLKQSFRKYTEKRNFCALGSVKSNIGHCLAAAGIAGFIKLILALKHRQLPPTINFDRLNEHIGLRESPFYVNDRLQAWDAPGAAGRLAAMSSFGFSGTNAHLVLGEYRACREANPPVTLPRQDGKIMVPLSARTAEQLRQKARDLLAFIGDEARREIDLVELAYTLQVGREPLGERAGFMAGSVEQLAQRLQTFIAGDSDPDCHQGQVGRNKEGMSIISQDDEMKEAIVDKCLAGRKLGKLLGLWARGLEFDWNVLYGPARPRRMNLPTYPFARERYWIAAAGAVRAVRSDGMASLLHPLLHTNTSDFRQQSYSSTFSGDEFFLSDHQVRTGGRSVQKVLPGVAYLEMARAAVTHASPAPPESSILELHNTVWLQPVYVGRQQELSIALFAHEGHERPDARIHYSFYSQGEEQEVLHCQGQAMFSHHPAPAQLDIARLRREMAHGHFDASRLYPMFSNMGLCYGAAHQGITSIQLGENQLLAQLSLPTELEDRHHEYVLHPSMMDSALQASIGLIVDMNRPPNQPSLPFAMECLRIVSACTKEIVAWVRHSPGSGRNGRALKLDIDLCDQDGNICVQVQGFTSRVLETAVEAQQHRAAAPRHGGSRPASDPGFDGVFYEGLIKRVMENEMSIDDAVELG